MGQITNKLAAKNAAWLVSSNFIRIGVNFIVGALVARYLAPDQYGILSTAIALATIFAIVSVFGTRDVAIVESNKSGGDYDCVLSNVKIIISIATLLVFPLYVCSAFIFSSEGADLTVILVVGVSILFSPIHVYKYMMVSRNKSRFIAISEQLSLFIFSCIKLVSIIFGAPLLAFAMIYVAEILFLSLLIAVGYCVQFSGFKYRLVSRVKIWSIAKKSSPLFFSSMAIILYMRIDQLMLYHFSGAAEVGIYSAAVRISEGINMVPVFVSAAFLPRFTQLIESSYAEFESKFSELMAALLFFAIGFSIFIMFVSEPLIRVFFGVEYERSSSVLNVLVWSSVLVYSAAIGNRWYILRGVSRYQLYWTLVGAVINVVANFILIPKFGAIGAAYATLISYIFPAFILDAFSKNTKPLFLIKANSIFGIPIIESLSRGRNAR